MDRLALIGAVRQQIGNAETEDAILLLLNYLKKGGRGYRNLYHEILQIQSQFNKTQKDEAQGIIAFENAKLNYNQVNKLILGVVENLESFQSPYPTQALSRKWQFWVAFSLGLIALTFVVGLVWSNDANWFFPDFPTSKVLVVDNCPPFSPNSSFNILVLPFKTFDDNKLKPHFAISDRLAHQSEQYNIQSDVKVLTLDQSDPNSFPKNSKDASAIGHNCNAQLVIWGTSEKSSSNQTIIQLRYKFLIGSGDQFQFRKIKLDERIQIDTISSVSSIATEGFLTSSIEQSLLLLFGVIASETGHPQAAIEILESFKTEDEQAELLQGLVLADNYLATEEDQKAIEVYDKILEQEPELGVARNNRGILHFKNGEYAESAEDLSIALEESPEDTMALKIRGTAYLKSERLNKAKEDLQKLKDLNPKDTAITQQLSIINNEVKATLAKDQAANEYLEFDPNDAEAIRERFRSNLKLGNYSLAIRYAEKLLKQNEFIEESYATIIGAYIALKKPEKAKKWLLDAIKKGITSKKLIEYVPEVKSLIKDIQTTKDEQPTS